MKKIRILSIVLCTILLLSVLVACDVSDVIANVNVGKPTVESAIINLRTLPYKLTMTQKTEYSGTMFAGYSKEETSVTYVDGNNYYMQFTESGMDTEITLFDGVLYTNIGGEYKYKQTIPMDEFEEALQEFVQIYDVTSFEEENFANVKKVENADGSVTYTYSNMSGELENFLNNSFGDLADITIDNDSVVYVFTIDSNGRLIYSTMNLEFTVTMSAMLGGLSTTATSYITAEYDYDDIKEIVAPEDADEYVELEDGNLFG